MDINTQDMNTISTWKENWYLKIWEYLRMVSSKNKHELREAEKCCAFPDCDLEQSRRIHNTKYLALPKQARLEQPNTHAVTSDL